MVLLRGRQLKAGTGSGAGGQRQVGARATVGVETGNGRIAAFAATGRDEQALFQLLDAARTLVDSARYVPVRDRIADADIHDSFPAGFFTRQRLSQMRVIRNC